MSNKVYFYQNNPCVIVREVNDDFVEVQISHHFTADMELTGHCQGCCVGDSDNKLSCTCDEFSWIIEEFQNEENKIIAMVERRLLLDNPIEQKSIEKLNKLINDKKSELENIKGIHKEWELSLKSIKENVKSLSLNCESLKLQMSGLNNINAEMIESNEKLSEQRDSILVSITEYGVEKRKVALGEIERLEKTERKMQALEAGGVDNWEWYSESLKNAGL